MRRWPLGVGAAAIAVMGVGVIALATGAAARHSSTEHLQPIAEASAASTVLQAERLPDGTVPWSSPLRLKVEHGTFHTVDVSDDAGNAIGGAQSADGTSWQSATSLIPTASYRVQTTTYDGKWTFNGRLSTAVSSEIGFKSAPTAMQEMRCPTILLSECSILICFCTGVSRLVQRSKTSKKSSKWPLLLAEIEAVWSKRGVDVVGASDSRELITRFQRAGLSEKRSSREVEEMLRRFDEKIRLAA